MRSSSQDRHREMASYNGCMDRHLGIFCGPSCLRLYLMPDLKAQVSFLNLPARLLSSQHLGHGPTVTPYF